MLIATITQEVPVSRDRSNITLHHPAEFIDFIKRHGMKVPTEEGPVVFKVEHDIDLPHELRTHSDDESQPTYDRYEAPVKLFDETAYVYFNAKPAAPRFWQHVNDQRIWRRLGSKKEVIEELTELGVEKELLKKFDKVRIAELKEMVDSSPADNGNVEEILRRRTVTPPDTLIFKLKDRFADEIRVVMGQERNESLKFTLTADYSRHWADRTAAIQRALEAAKFKVYSGSLS